jgi:hypothetical protein
MTSTQLSVYPVMQMFRHLKGHHQAKIIRIKHKMLHHPMDIYHVYVHNKYLGRTVIF